MIVEFRAIRQYDPRLIEPLVDELLDPIADKIIPQKTALLKPNLLMMATPDRAITTHPTIVEAVAKHLIDRGMKVIIADSPGGPFRPSLLEAVYRATGMMGVAERTGAKLNFDLSCFLAELTSAKTLHRFEVLNVIKQADLIINLPKCKTHGMMTYTGAVKNLYGVIPGLTKANHHFRLPDSSAFGHHLVDVAEYVAADYHLIDGIVSMEGDGPSGGQPVRSGFLAAARSPHQLDRAVLRLIGIDEALVPTIRSAMGRGLLSQSPTIAGDEITVTPFRLPASSPVTFLPAWVPGSIHHRLAKAIRSKPIFRHERCIGCARCAEICPAKVITMDQNRRPVCDYDHCISCFCCHEICPVRAIDLKRSWLGNRLKK
ncbi:MAG TPA: DUF362 domain-containing protein [Tissierellia bacterium]|nr:DUF362 domain-containing protein [Tissierellia bacterium]